MVMAHTTQQAVNTIPLDPSSVTYAGTAATVALWGLHISDIAVIASALASVLGFFLQFYLAFRRIAVLEEQQKKQSVQNVVQKLSNVTQMAVANDQENRIANIEDKVEDGPVMVLPPIVIHTTKE